MRKKTPKKLFLLIFLSVFCMAAAQKGPPQPRLPLDNAPVGHQSVLSLGQEADLGLRIMGELEAQSAVSSDEVVNSYLQRLGNQVSAAAKDSPFPLTIFAIPSRDLNAFTFFGGHIGVHYGLLMGVGNESELLAVLAHENAHITQRHLARSIENQRRMMPVAMAEALGALAIGALTSPEAGVHATQAIMQMHFHKMLSFSRAHEQEADREAIQTLDRMSVNPKSLPTVFERFNKASAFQDNVPEYLRTHPLNEARIADAENRINQLPFKRQAEAADHDFDWIVGRVLADSFFGSKKSLLGSLEDNLKAAEIGSPEWRQMQYAKALSLQGERHYKEAEVILQNLLKAYPDAWILRLSLAEAQYLKGEQAAGLAQMAALTERYPKQYAIAITYGDYLIRDKKAALAKKWLLRHHHQVHSAKLLQLLTQAHRQLNDVTSVHQTQAEWHLLRGDIKQAKLQVDLATQHVKEKDPIALAKIEELKDKIAAWEQMPTL